MASVDDRLITVYASHSIYLNRVAAKFGNDVIPYLENIEKGINKILSSVRRSTIITPELRRQLEAEINELARLELQSYTTEYKQNNKDLAESEVAFHAKTLESVIDDYSANVPSVAAVNTLALTSPFPLGDDLYTTYPRYVNTYWKTYAQKIDDAVRSAFLGESLTITAIQNEILDQFDIITPKAVNAARTMARTGTAYYTSKSTEAFVDKNDEVLEGYLFVAVHDNRTTRQCSRLDGNKYKANDKNIPWPPLHPNCRSEIIYDVKEDFKYDDSASRKPSNFTGADGVRDVKRIDTKKTFYENLKGMSAKDQDFILQSPTLGKAFRKMDDPKRFAKQLGDKMNQPLTIAEMKEKNNELGRILRAQDS